MNKHYLLFVLVVLTACNKTPETLEEYLDWTKDYRQIRLVEQQSESYHFQLEYRPIPLLIAQELGIHPDSTSLRHRYKEIKGLQYFNLFIKPIESNGISSISRQHQQQDIGNYLSYEMQNDLFLLEGQDSMKCVLFHFESYADLNHKNNFVLAFERKDKTNMLPKTIILQPSLFNDSPVIFKYNTETLTQIPTLSWEK